MNILSKYNLTKISLNSNDIFTGNIEVVSNYNYITISIFSDVDSSPNGLELYFSNDTTISFTNIIKYTYYKNINKEFTVKNNYKYFYIKYTNSSTDQTIFHLNTIYKLNNDLKQYIEFNNAHIDTFNRLRISSLQTLYELTQIDNKNFLKEDEYTSGSGNATYNSNTSMVTLSVSGIGRVVRQSRLYTHYQPGKSFLILLTGILNNNNDPQVTTRLGYYDDNNGLFYECSNSTYYVVMRSNTSGSVINTKITQNNWNIDTMDGNGPSRINIDFTKYLIFTINFSWLGAGIVNIGVYYAGTHYLIHCFRNTDILVPYIRTPHLPGRYEIINTEATGNGDIIEACMSINSETSQNVIGQTFSIGTTSARTINGTEDYVMSIRLKDNERKNIILKTISLICNTKGNIEYKIYLVLSPSTNPITDSSFQNVNIHSGVQYDISGTVFDTTNAIVLYQSYFSSIENIGTRQLSDKNDPIYLTAGINIDSYKSDYIVITGRNITGTNNETINCIFNWIEI
jgi:hypothetical protein